MKCLCLHSDSGIGLESGVFVASLSPGSPAARDGALTVGDRLLAVSMLPKPEVTFKSKVGHLTQFAMMAVNNCL